MKIAINTLVTPREKVGVGNYLSNLIAQLQVVDPENYYYVFTCPETRDLFPLHAKNFTEVCSSFFKTSPGSSVLARLLWLHTTFLKKSRSLGIDLIHIPNTEFMLWKQPATVVSILDLAEWHVKKYSFLRTFYRKLSNTLQAKRSRRILTISQSSKRDIVKILHVPESKIEVTYLAVPGIFHNRIVVSEAQSFLKEYYGIARDYILSVAAFDKHKNIRGILHAVASIKRDRRIPWNLVVVGKGGPVYNEMHSLIRELRLEEDVILTGYIPDEHLPYFYSGAKMSIFPSFWEGFGIPALEAMACGCPLICSNRSSLPEVTGGAAILVDPSQPVQIAEAISLIEHDQELERRLRLEGPRQASRFNYRKTAELTIAAYLRAFREGP